MGSEARRCSSLHVLVSIKNYRVTRGLASDPFMASTFDAKFSVTNIDSADFTGYNGGEPYVLRAGETREFPKFLAEHLAKHLLDRILQERHNVKNTIQDTPLRRQLLYKILTWKEQADLELDKEANDRRRQIDSQEEVRSLNKKLDALTSELVALKTQVEEKKKVGRPPKTVEPMPST